MIEKDKDDLNDMAGRIGNIAYRIENGITKGLSPEKLAFLLGEVCKDLENIKSVILEIVNPEEYPEP